VIASLTTARAEMRIKAPTRKVSCSRWKRGKRSHGSPEGCRAGRGAAEEQASATASATAVQQQEQFVGKAGPRRRAQLDESEPGSRERESRANR
jgi:hypothetical protein